jgi:hypothetical protein
VASDISYSYAQTGTVDVVWVVVPAGMDCGSIFGTDKAGGARLIGLWSEGREWKEG